MPYLCDFLHTMTVRDNGVATVPGELHHVCRTCGELCINHCFRCCEICSAEEGTRHHQEQMQGWTYADFAQYLGVGTPTPAPSVGGSTTGRAILPADYLDENYEEIEPDIYLEDPDDEDYERERRRGRGLAFMHDYSADARDVLNIDAPRGERAFGIELEFNPRGYENQQKILSALSSSKARGKWIGKEDGSLPDYGVEVVSAPGTYADLTKWITDLFEQFDTAGVDLNFPRGCGTHVHVSRAHTPLHAVTKVSHLLRRSARYRKARDIYDFLIAVARRESNHYCDYSSRAAGKLEPKVSKRAGWERDWGKQLTRQGTGHYAAISCSDRYPTYEFRLFAGVRSTRQALACLEATQWLIEAMTPHDMTPLLSLPALLETLAANAGAYPNLIERFSTGRDRLRAFKPQLDEASAAITGKKFPALFSVGYSHAPARSRFKRMDEAAKKFNPMFGELVDISHELAPPRMKRLIDEVVATRRITPQSATDFYQQIFASLAADMGSNQSGVSF